MFWLLLACGPRPPLAPETPATTGPPPVLPERWVGPAEVSRASLVAVGDLLMHTNVKNSAKAANVVDTAGKSTNHSGYSALFEEVPWIAEADIAFANLETPVAPKAGRGTASMVFNVVPDLLPALESVGFDVLSFANNHVYDQGRDGFVETMEQLDGTNMTWIGGGTTCAEARKARITETNGIKIGWIGSAKVYNDNLNKGPDEACSFELDVPAALASAKAARAAGAELIVVSVHWGHEYKVEPSQAEVDDARALMDGGADVVIGHHAHVVQPIEVHETPDGRIAVTAYSLGNFISNQRYDYKHSVHPISKGDPRDGLALSLDVVKKNYGPGPDGEAQVRVELANVQGIPLWTDNDAGRIVHPKPRIRVVRTDDALTRAYADLKEAKTPETQLAAKKRVALLNDRRARVESILGTTLTPAAP